LKKFAPIILLKRCFLKKLKFLRLVIALLGFGVSSVLADEVIVGGLADPDGGGGIVVEHHFSGDFSGPAKDWPWAAAARIDADSDFWIGFGLYLDHFVSETVFIEASFMPGYYNPEDTDLGGNIHFRSLLGIGIAVTDQSSISLSIDHLSNGGLTSNNPGSEAIALRYKYRLF